MKSLKISFFCFQDETIEMIGDWLDGKEVQVFAFHFTPFSYVEEIGLSDFQPVKRNPVRLHFFSEPLSSSTPVSVELLRDAPGLFVTLGRESSSLLEVSFSGIKTDNEKEISLASSLIRFLKRNLLSGLFSTSFDGSSCYYKSVYYSSRVKSSLNEGLKLVDHMPNRDNELKVPFYHL